MYKYRVIIVNDDNTIYRVYGFSTKREAQKFSFNFADSAFVVCIVTEDCFNYSDSDIVKKARKRTKIV